ncbi:hypothetical protein [Desulfonema ishimotonii]|uniref:hypothetical protein n=1 Tax=Desulfonema ishimotonii TaxID=45657 RepID=UPI000F583D37|nr:hypothetical protein [Desulfonema ishimotonii]
MRTANYIFLLLFISIILLGCHRNSIKRIDISNKFPYKTLIGKIYILKRDSYVFSITKGKTLLISNCGKRSWIGPAVLKIDQNLIGASLSDDVKILCFYPKGTFFTISKVYNDITRLGCGGPVINKFVMINIGKYKLVGVDHLWIKETFSHNNNIKEIFKSEYAAINK